MAPLLPLLFILLIPFALLTIGLMYFGVKGNKLSLTAGLFFCLFFGIILYHVIFHKNIIHNKYTGTYIGNDTTDNHPKIKLVLTATDYTITPNSFTNCYKGTWELKVMDYGDVIDFSCSNGRNAFELYIDNKELKGGNIKFIKQN